MRQRGEPKRPAVWRGRAVLAPVPLRGVPQANTASVATHQLLTFQRLEPPHSRFGWSATHFDLRRPLRQSIRLEDGKVTTLTTHGLQALALPALTIVGLAGAGVAQDHAHEDAAEGALHQMAEGEGTMEGHGVDAGGMHAGDHAAAAAAVSGSPATEAYRAANLAMHSAMDIEFSDDADIDFARGMIGHHQGAIDMARVVIEHGQDPDLRQLAEEIIAAQEAEIASLRDWIADHAPE